jgi:hypothetical protein
MHHHTLIVGGTGMLTDASIALGLTTGTLSSVACTQSSLKALDAKLKDFAGTHHLLQLNACLRKRVKIRHTLSSIRV